MITVTNYNPYTSLNNLDNLIVIYKFVLDYGYSIELKRRLKTPAQEVYWFRLTEQNTTKAECIDVCLSTTP
jgi:hypothetical protein